MLGFTGTQERSSADLAERRANSRRLPFDVSDVCMYVFLYDFKYIGYDDVDGSRASSQCNYPRGKWYFMIDNSSITLKLVSI